MNDAWSFETKQIHAGQVADEASRARALPIYQTTSYTFRDTDHAAALFGLAETGNIYTRIMNPTTAVVEERIAALEGGIGALLVAQRPGGRDARDPEHRRGPATTSCRALGCTAAPTTSSTTRCRSSASRSASSTTRTTSSPGARRCSRTPRLFFGETISNPKNDILDIEAVAAVAHEAGVPLVVDNTVATPYLHPAARVGRGHRRALGDEVPRRPRHRDRRRRSSTAAPSTGRPTPSGSRASRPPTRATTAWSTPRRSAPAAVHRQGCACSCCATSGRRWRRSTRS